MMQWENHSTICKYPCKSNNYKKYLNLIKPLDLSTTLQKTEERQKFTKPHCKNAISQIRIVRKSTEQMTQFSNK